MNLKETQVALTEENYNSHIGILFIFIIFISRNTTFIFQSYTLRDHTSPLKSFF